MSSPGAGRPALVLDRVTAAYGADVVLQDLSLTVPRGTVLGVLGPNGCGKTTLLRVAAGWLRPLSGSVMAAGLDVPCTSPRDLARRVAVVPQEGGALFPMSVLETVLLARFPWHPVFAFEADEDIDVAHAALEEVDADHLADRDVSTLSGGERQRVLVARALCQGGELLLCDEPTAHLDLKHQAATFRLLRGLTAGNGAAGRTVVVVTHDLNLAAQACDRLVLLGPDGLVAAGSPAEVVETAHLRTAFGMEAEVHHDEDGVPWVRRRIG